MASLRTVAFKRFAKASPPHSVALRLSNRDSGQSRLPAMTADGIACLAMGIAVNPEPPPFLGHNSEQVQAVRKNCILNALQGMSGSIGEPQKDPKKVAKLKKDNTYYFLFSVNQMANMLGLKTIAGKDWHTWGTQLILANQDKDGGWQGAFGAADTAFALLFLTKSNLTPAATARLRDEIRDPGLPKFMKKKKDKDKSPGEK